MTVSGALPEDANKTTDADGHSVGADVDGDDDSDRVIHAVSTCPTVNPIESIEMDSGSTGEDNADPGGGEDGHLDRSEMFWLDMTESIDTHGDRVGANADTDRDSDIAVFSHVDNVANTDTD